MNERTRRRNRLFLIGLLPAVVLLGIAFQLWRLTSANDAALSAYASGDYADAREGFLGVRDLGVVEPWIRHFNAGTSAYQEKAYADAVGHLEDALEDVPDDEQCTVRVNLALAHEAEGLAHQTAKSEGKALIAFRDGRHALAEGGCGDAEVDARLEKQISTINAKGPARSSKENAELTEEEKLAKLEKLNEEARRRQKDDPVDPTEEPDVAIQW